MAEFVRVLREGTLVGEIVLDPAYMPPWPGAGIKSVRKLSEGNTMAALSNATYGVTPDATMAETPQVIDGAVAELSQHDDGTITADIRIPGPAVP